MKELFTIFVPIEIRSYDTNFTPVDLRGQKEDERNTCSLESVILSLEDLMIQLKFELGKQNVRLLLDNTLPITPLFIY